MAHEGLTTMPARMEESAAAAQAKIQEVADAAEAKVKPVADSTVADVKKAAATAQAAAAVTGAKVAADATKVAADAGKVAPSEGNELEWARWASEQLRRVPSIQLFGQVKLAELAGRGPAQAQAVWNTAQAVLGKNYGQMTVADLFRKFTS
jgi:hypothetical protein